MQSSFAFFTLFSILLFAGSRDARKDPGEYWREATNGEPMPKSIEALVGIMHRSPTLSTEGPKSILGREKKDTSLWIFHDDKKDGEDQLKMKKQFDDDFEPRPNISVYHDDEKGDQEKLKKKKEFADDFEPRPNISVYHDDEKGDQEKLKKKKEFADDFEPRPNISVYHDDEKGDQEKLKKKKEFADDFEPRPNISVYHDDEEKLKKMKKCANDFGGTRPTHTSIY